MNLTTGLEREVDLLEDSSSMIKFQETMLKSMWLIRNPLPVIEGDSSRRDPDYGYCGGVCISKDGYILTVDSLFAHGTRDDLPIEGSHDNFQTKIPLKLIHRGKGKNLAILQASTAGLNYYGFSDDEPRLNQSVASMVGFSEGRHRVFVGRVACLNKEFRNIKREIKEWKNRFQTERIIATAAMAHGTRLIQITGTGAEYRLGFPIFETSGTVIGFSMETRTIESVMCVCLLWEIYCCDMCYPNLSFSEVTSAVVGQNLRPEIPRCCPSSLANVMKQCWDDKRPEMDEVVSLLEAINTSKGGGMIPGDQPQGCLCFRRHRGP